MANSEIQKKRKKSPNNLEDLDFFLGNIKSLKLNIKHTKIGSASNNSFIYNS